MSDIEAIASISVNCGFGLHRDLGPGLLESVYEILLAEGLNEAGLRVDRQVAVPINFKGVVIDNAFRADLLVERCLLMNFGQALFKDGIQRIVNNHTEAIR